MFQVLSIKIHRPEVPLKWKPPVLSAKDGTISLQIYESASLLRILDQAQNQHTSGRCHTREGAEGAERTWGGKEVGFPATETFWAGGH